MKKSAIALTCVLCTLMLIATLFSVSVNAVNAATTEVMLTVEEQPFPKQQYPSPLHNRVQSQKQLLMKHRKAMT